MVYLYDKNKAGKFVIALNYDFETFKPEMYSGYHKGIFISREPIINPIVDNGIVISNPVYETIDIPKESVEPKEDNFQIATSLWRQYIQYDTPRCQAKLRNMKSLTSNMEKYYNNFMDSLELFLNEYENIVSTGIPYEVPTPSIELQEAISKIKRW